MIFILSKEFISSLLNISQLFKFNQLQNYAIRMESLQIFLVAIILMYRASNYNSKNMDLLSDIKIDPDDMETYKISFKHNQEAQLKKLVNYLQNDVVVVFIF